MICTWGSQSFDWGSRNKYFKNYKSDKLKNL